MSVFERYLTVWVGLCIVVGVALGHVLPGVFQAIGAAEHANVNIPMAVLIWLMIIPMLVRIDFASLRKVGAYWRGIGITLFINWAVKPFSMALLGWLFIGHLFRPWLPAEQIDSYIAGLIILAAAPCTAMVFVWSNLTRGEPHFTLSQVALNDAIMILAFAPIVALLLGLSAITVPWNTLVLSVALYIVVPVIVAQVLRRALLARGGAAAIDKALSVLQPLSIGALLATLVLLFGFQGEQIIAQPLVIALLAVPILIQVYFNSGLAYLLNRVSGEQHCVAGPSALIGASNFFELAVAAAISLFGFNSGAALATVVGVLVEVPVMLSVVWIVNNSRDWYERGAAARAPVRSPGRPDQRTRRMSIVLYHNPACGTSRNVLAIIRASGEEPEVIEYLQTPPSRERLVALIAAAGLTVRAAMRQKGTPYVELGLDDPGLGDDRLLDAMLAHPILINRPFVETPLGRAPGPPLRGGARNPAEPAYRRVPQGGWRAGPSARAAPWLTAPIFRTSCPTSSSSPTARSSPGPPPSSRASSCSTARCASGPTAAS